MYPGDTEAETDGDAPVDQDGVGVADGEGDTEGDRVMVGNGDGDSAWQV